MSLVRVFLALAIATVVSMPQRAEAGKWWEYIDKLSGPGPFNGAVVLSYRLPKLDVSRAVSAAEQAKPNYTEALDAKKLYAAVEYGLWDAKKDDRFDRVTLQSVLVLSYIPAHFVRGIDVGGGIGAFRFSGPGVARNGVLRATGSMTDGSFWTPVIPVRINVTPSEFFADKLSKNWRRYLSGIRYQFGEYYVPRSFDNRDFTAPNTYKTRDHWLGSIGVIIDLSPLAFR